MRLLRLSLKILMILMGSVVLGILLLYLVFSLPEDAIYKHARKAKHIFAVESVYPQIEGKTAKMLDNFTDAYMINNAFYKKEGIHTLRRAMEVYRPTYEGGNPADDIQRYVAGVPGYQETPCKSYWHGYLLFLKPFLLVADYLLFRNINPVLQGILIIMTMILLWKKVSWKCVLPFALTFLYLRPDAVRLSMFFSVDLYIAIFSLWVTMLFHQKLLHADNYFCFFLIIGIIANYLGFFGYPLISLGLPLCLWVFLEKGRTCLEKIGQIIGCSICWGVGYGGMWIGKWVAGSLILRENLVTGALAWARVRASTVIDTGESITRFGAIAKNFNIGFGKIVWLAIVIVSAVCVIGLWQMKGDWKGFLMQSAPFLLIGMMPIVWYMFLSNHSYIHGWFTYRTLSVSVFAILLIATVSPTEERAKNERRE